MNPYLRWEQLFIQSPPGSIMLGIATVNGVMRPVFPFSMKQESLYVQQEAYESGYWGLAG